MLREKIKGIYLYRHTLWSMAVAQLKTKYSGSVLGIFWAVINPLLVMFAITFVFVVVFKIEIKNFALFALSGIFPWNFFSLAISDAAFSFLNYKNVLHQFNLPREIIPLSSVLSNFLNFLIGWIIIYPLFLFFNLKIIILFPVLVIILLLQFFFVCGLGLTISIANVFFRDFGQLLGVLLMLWFWITPIFYSVEMVPEKFRWICNFNPLTPYIIYYQQTIFKGILPPVPLFISTFLWAFLSVLMGLWLFQRLEPKLLKRI